jgi:HSP20 family molecular chaperone IbpA
LNPNALEEILADGESSALVASLALRAARKALPNLDLQDTTVWTPTPIQRRSFAEKHAAKLERAAAEARAASLTEVTHNPVDLLERVREHAEGPTLPAPLQRGPQVSKPLVQPMEGATRTPVSPAYTLKENAEHLVVTVHLPEVHSVAEIDLDVETRRLRLEVLHTYRLDIPLPAAVVPAQVTAKFVKATGQLKLKLPKQLQ